MLPFISLSFVFPSPVQNVRIEIWENTCLFVIVMGLRLGIASYEKNSDSSGVPTRVLDLRGRKQREAGENSVMNFKVCTPHQTLFLLLGGSNQED
jgi:hypothetical protein